MQSVGPYSVILAGGRSSRMGGGDKGLQTLGAASVIQHVLDRLRPQSGSIALNANGDPTRFAALGLPVLPDPLPGQPGPLAGVLAAMDWAASQGEAQVVTVAADTPFFPADLVARLTQAARPGCPCLAATPGSGVSPDWHPTFGLWPVALRDDLRQTLQDGQRKVLTFAQRHGATAALYDAGADPFFNINTPADLAMARARHDL